VRAVIQLEYCSRDGEGLRARTSSFSRPKPSAPRTFGPGLTPEERDAQARRTTIQLALARARADLEVARRPAHTRMLTQAIAALKHQLAQS